MQQPIKVGITHGDINGISYEVILKALADPTISELCTPIILGSAKLAVYFRKMLNMEEPNFVSLRSLDDVRDGAINLYNITESELKVDIGEATEESGRAALLSLQEGCKALREGKIDVLVTAPINKHAIHSEDFDFPGHTEYLEATIGDGAKSLMILFSDDLRVATLTTHLPLAKVPQAVKKEAIEDTLRRFEASLKRDFGIEKPRIAVLSLNPHSGDNGLLGQEEQKEIIPAIQTLSDEGMMVFGPFGADGFFGSGAYKKYDGILSMYHDQGLAPFKTIAGAEGVNFTAGLPYVRTSPDHGTAYDIVGRNEADPTSMRRAIFAAIDIARSRRRIDEAARNPLRKQYEARGADKTVDLTKED